MPTICVLSCAHLHLRARVLTHIVHNILKAVRNNTVTKLTATRRLRCATFLLQLCSTILKTGRGSSHPECAEQPLDPPRTSGGDAALEGNKCGASADNSREDRLMPTADACAELASECLVGIVENASEIMRKYRSDATSEYSAEPCDSVDIMFWALSLVSDVIKNFARRRWTCRGGTGRVFPEREAGLVNKTVSGTSASQASQTVDDARHNTVPIGDEASSEIGSCLDILDISRLVRVIAAVPIETGSHMVDVALKWLEVTQVCTTQQRTTYTTVGSALRPYYLSLSPVKTMWPVNSTQNREWLRATCPEDLRIRRGSLKAQHGRPCTYP